jgi:hypothetical protein
MMPPIAVNDFGRPADPEAIRLTTYVRFVAHAGSTAVHID